VLLQFDAELNHEEGREKKQKPTESARSEKQMREQNSQPVKVLTYYDSFS